MVRRTSLALLILAAGAPVAAALPVQTYPTRTADSIAIWTARSLAVTQAAARNAWTYLAERDRMLSALLASLARVDTLRIPAGRDTLRLYCTGNPCRWSTTPPPGSDVLPASAPPWAGVRPYVTVDFSQWRSTAALLKDESVFSPGWNANNEDGKVTLDPTGGMDGGPAMAFNFPDRTATGGSGTSGRCTDFTISRLVGVPRSTREMWVELYAKFSPHWTVRAPASWRCTSNPDYKFVFGAVQGSDAIGWHRFHLDMQPHQWTVTWPNNPLGESGIREPNPLPPRFWDGQYHRYRFHWKLSTSQTTTDGGIRVWVDDYLLFQQMGVVAYQHYFDGLRLGANLNQGPGAPQSVWWDNIRIWTQNPGW